ncbi:hypothetical protein SDC9_105737 [bioreactor metagenome]|uniref:DUF354 domain-containing protein n=1 Tax=bioreactor metagenome TaxID=1076179 RepID=A0A645BB33_9ZZZZ|nr:DUF354 domain-containing protein [Paludibacter sp.]
MKIWIDLTNSPHINFFKPFVKKWEQEGNEIIITTRNLANTIALIQQNGWNYTEIGGHAGKNKLKKLLYFPRRVFLLYRYLKQHKPNIGVTQSSFYAPVAGKFAGIPTIYMNDNEHAKGNLLAFKYASLNIIPEFLKSFAVSNRWNKKFKIDYYPGIKEGIYLSQFSFNSYKKEKSQECHNVFIRLEPWTAQYYTGKNNFMDELIVQLKNNYSITILPRSSEQAKHYQTKEFKGIYVANKPIPLEEIYEKCSVFIGAGGSMTRELAYLGIPTLSVYQDELLEVDKFLIENKYMFFSTSPSIDEITNILKDNTIKSKKELYQMGKKAFDMINEKVFEYAKN